MFVCGLEDNVRAWMSTVGQGTPDGVKIPEKSVQDLRESLILEECQEYSVAQEKLRNASTPAEGQDALVELLDAICDILYVTVGSAVAFGFPLEDAVAEVCRSNDSKIPADGIVVKNSAGKVLKPATFSPPDLRTVLTEAQN